MQIITYKLKLLFNKNVWVVFRQFGKPEGAASCEFYYKVDGDAPASPADCPMRIMATRSPVMLNFDSGMSGRRIWTYSRWMNATGQGGQWIINAVSAVIP